MSYPLIIQGGMGAGVSNWTLAKAVSRMGQLGVVSGTALDVIFSRRLQMGDIGEHIRRALKHFPFPEMAQRIFNKFFISHGKSSQEPFKGNAMFLMDTPQTLQELTVVANFTEVFLAKEGHSGIVGINFLEKIQLPNLFSIYGAMLAGVDYVMMGAGIPREIPGILEKFSRHEKAELTLNVEGSSGEDLFKISFDPQLFMEKNIPFLRRPKFIAIIASTILGLTLIKKCTPSVDGFVIEGAIAGGHNAMPRGALALNERGEPVYGPKDDVDLEKIKALGLPFWLAGSFSTPEKLKEAHRLGAVGVQVGTAFAFSQESGLDPIIKERLIEKALKGETDIFTDPVASPTKFPFKVVALEGSNSEKKVYEERERICDLGYLRHLYKKEDGTVGYRCPAEPLELYLKKGGSTEETLGRKCLCNGLLANIGLAQCSKDGYLEKPLVTAGEDFRNITRFLKEGSKSYSARDVIDYLLSEPAEKNI